jgi:hypothetical protein
MARAFPKSTFVGYDFHPVAGELPPLAHPQALSDHLRHQIDQRDQTAGDVDVHADQK